MTRDGIAALIPHSGTMCLLARLDAWDTQRIGPEERLPCLN